MVMNSYMWPKKRFMNQSKPSMVKAMNKENEEDRFKQILEKLNHLESPVKPIRVELHSESQLEEESYVNNTLIQILIILVEEIIRTLNGEVTKEEQIKHKLDKTPLINLHRYENILWETTIQHVLKDSTN